MSPRTRRILATSLFALGWMATVGFGLHTLFGYEHKAGTVGAVPPRWPDSQLKRATDRPTLVLAAHPRCTCTRATLDELAAVMAHAPGKFAAYVLLVTPKEGGTEWNDTSLRRQAEQIPGVTVVSDIDGAEARRFGTETSGHALLFAPDGRLLFNGGITASRGHSGDNAGEDSILALLGDKKPATTQTMVFGCALEEHSHHMADDQVKP